MVLVTGEGGQRSDACEVMGTADVHVAGLRGLSAKTKRRLSGLRVSERLRIEALASLRRGLAMK